MGHGSCGDIATVTKPLSVDGFPQFTLLHLRNMIDQLEPITIVTFFNFEFSSLYLIFFFFAVSVLLEFEPHVTKVKQTVFKFCKRCSYCRILNSFCTSCSLLTLLWKLAMPPVFSQDTCSSSTSNG